MRLNCKPARSSMGDGCGRTVRPRLDELTMNKFLGLLMLSALLTGCTTSITNLTPSQCPRDASGFYRVETEWFSRRQVVRPDSFKPLVVVNGFDTYPMRRVPLVKDRWEGYIPVPASSNMVYYHFKFDFMDTAIGHPRPNSMMSRDYVLTVK